jgi:hypothetical protein
VIQIAANTSKVSYEDKGEIVAQATINTRRGLLLELLDKFSNNQSTITYMDIGEFTEGLGLSSLETLKELLDKLKEYQIQPSPYLDILFHMK